MSYLEGARDKLEQAALRYARMRLLGNYIESGTNNIVHVGPRDKEDHEKFYANGLLDAAINLFSEVAATPLPPRK